MKNFIRNQNLLAVVAVALFAVLSNLWIATFPLDQGDNVAAVGVAVAPKVAKVSVVGTPYLAFGINPITREESLNGQIKVNVTALPNQDAYIVKRGAFNPHASEIDVISGPLPYPNLRDSVHGIVTYKPDSLANMATSSLVGANMDAYVIKKGKTVTFTIDVKFNPRQMYGGSYKMFIEEAYVGTIDTSGNAVQDVKVVPLGKRVSNKVVIFGETSPYVSGSVSKENADGSTGLIALFGVRFDNQLKLYANGNYVKTLTSTSTDRQGIRQVTFDASELSLTTDSNVSLQIESSKNGKSNAVYQSVVVPKEAKDCPNLSTVTFTRDLNVGSSGDDVLGLQCFLISKGYLISTVKSGYFGPTTKSALASYQTARGISPADGSFGPVTRAAINADLSSNPTSSSTIDVKPVSVSSRIGNLQNTGEFKFTFDVKSNSGDVYITRGGYESSNLQNPTGVFFDVYKNGSGVRLGTSVTSDINVVPSTGVTIVRPYGYDIIKISEGNTARLTLNTSLTNTSSSSSGYAIYIRDIKFATSLEGVNINTFDLSNNTEFKSNQLVIAGLPKVTVCSTSSAVAIISPIASSTAGYVGTGKTMAGYQIKFKLTAPETDDIYVPQGIGQNDLSKGISYKIYDQNNNEINSAINVAFNQVISSAPEIGSYYRVFAGNTDSFTINVGLDNTASGMDKSLKIIPTSVNYDVCQGGPSKHAQLGNTYTAGPILLYSAQHASILKFLGTSILAWLGIWN